MGSPELFAVLMAGGSGTRFWPASRRKLPKQYLPIGTDAPLIRVTFERLAGLVEPARVLVVASRAHARLVRAILPEIPAENVLLEPVGRNTTPCVAWAASTIAARAPSSVQVVLPSDHVIHPAQEFRALLESAARAAAREDALITLGVHPTSPATGYGYIERGAEQPGLLQPVQRFVEKPERALAEQFVASGRFLWNAGIFVWSTRAILAALREFAPRTLEGAQGLGRAPDRKTFARLESIAIDRSVMERARNVRVIPMRLQWSDVGAWDALGPQNGGGELVALESSNCISWAGPGELVALLGVQDLVVVHAGKATLVCPRARAGHPQAGGRARAARQQAPLMQSGALAIDHGTKRTGFAYADALRISLNALEPFHGPGDAPALLEHLARLVAERSVGTLLLGLPLNMDGSEGPRAAEVRAFSERLRARFPAIALVLVDERLSTKEAEELLRESGLRGEKARALRDSFSALVVLRDWVSTEKPG